MTVRGAGLVTANGGTRARGIHRNRRPAARRQGHYHDLLNDLGKEEVLGDVIAWLEAREGSRQ